MELAGRAKNISFRTYIIAILTILSVGGFVFAETSTAGLSDVELRKAQLEAELAIIQQEIEAERVNLQEKQKEAVSLERDVAILNSSIHKAELGIRARNLTISELLGEIDNKKLRIDALNAKVDRQKASLSQLMRKTNEMDDQTLVEVILGNQKISDFFLDMDTFEAVKQSLNESSAELRDFREKTEEERLILEEQRNREVDLRVEQEYEKSKLEKAERQKGYILSETRGEERVYADIIAEKERKAAQIRATLFALRDSSAIPFGRALDFAIEASDATGVRPAFILAILTQESNLGENVGQCYLRNTETGSGVGKNTGRHFDNVMKPSRDVEPFVVLAKELGFDPFNTPVSCPQGIGYGGAMGPSQFIPSTWEIYKSKVARATGHNPANPWEPEDAFMATALFVADLGADKGGYSAEREAAARYYAGGYWKKNGLGYAASVLSIASDIQENMIDPLMSY